MCFWCGEEGLSGTSLRKSGSNVLFSTGRCGKSRIARQSWRKGKPGKTGSCKETPPVSALSRSDVLCSLIGNSWTCRTSRRGSKMFVFMFLLSVGAGCSSWFCFLGEKRRLRGEGRSGARRNERREGINHQNPRAHVALLFPKTARVPLRLIMLFQGEMGSEGLRGLPGETGNKGAKVRFILPLSDSNLSPGILIVLLFPVIAQGDNGLPGPRGSPGAPGEAGRNVGESSRFESRGRNLRRPISRSFVLKTVTGHQR